MQFGFSTPREIARGMKRIQESKIGTPSLVRIKEDVDLALKALGNFYLENGAAFEGLADRNGYRQKVVGKGKIVSWGGAPTKGKGRECKTTKNIFFHCDLLKLCMKKNTASLISSLTQLCFVIRNLTLIEN